MSPLDVLTATVIILGFFSVLTGFIVLIALIVNTWAYDRNQDRINEEIAREVQELERALAFEPPEPTPLQFYRARKDRHRGSA